MAALHRAGCTAALAGVLLTATAASARDGTAAPEPSATSRQERPAMRPIARHFAPTGIEGTGGRLEVDFHQGAEDAARVEYRLQPTGDADLAVFDRGDR